MSCKERIGITKIEEKGGLLSAYEAKIEHWTLTRKQAIDGLELGFCGGCLANCDNCPMNESAFLRKRLDMALEQLLLGGE